MYVLLIPRWDNFAVLKVDLTPAGIKRESCNASEISAKDSTAAENTVSRLYDAPVS